MLSILVGTYIRGNIRVPISSDFLEDEVDYLTYLDKALLENCPKQWNVNLKTKFSSHKIWGHSQTLVGQK